ncbi:transposase [Streptomyces sp. NPDC127039]|uniref:transposase n=1 Tax=Streptomyces sp. NPDC127039 TaxID=3347115 RepID=UPI00364AA0A7
MAGPGGTPTPCAGTCWSNVRRRYTGKRHLWVDAPGLLLAVRVSAAGVSDNAGGIHLLSQTARASAHVTKARADAGHRTKVIDHAARLGIGLGIDVAQHNPGTKGFKVIPPRWVIEPTFGRLTHHRRPARDYESHAHRVVRETA